ncbi:hypothetical protein [Candidatus Pseudoscillospira sp. SGI.172]|uniref:hypothetical protein n=1 Tax=Candidatus Pseudoscillospira sp. SGI.172 TaxID=3420582 RepID=UPI003D074E49
MLPASRHFPCAHKHLDIIPQGYDGPPKSPAIRMLKLIRPNPKEIQTAVTTLGIICKKNRIPTAAAKTVLRTRLMQPHPLKQLFLRSMGKSPQPKILRPFERPENMQEQAEIIAPAMYAKPDGVSMYLSQLIIRAKGRQMRRSADEERIPLHVIKGMSIV